MTNEAIMIEIESIKDEIAHTCDGPLTAFVLIARSAELARKYAPDHIANALYELLGEFGWLREGDESVHIGS